MYSFIHIIVYCLLHGVILHKEDNRMHFFDITIYYDWHVINAERLSSYSGCYVAVLYKYCLGARLHLLSSHTTQRGAYCCPSRAGGCLRKEAFVIDQGPCYWPLGRMNRMSSLMLGNSSCCYCFHSIFTVRRYALHGLCDRNSVRLSVPPSVCPSVWHTRALCPHGSTTIIFSSPYGSPTILVSGDITSSQNSKGVTPSECVEWGWGGYELAIFDQKSPYLRNGARYDKGYY